MRKSTKTEITKASILKAVSDGARNMTQIAHAHGYVGNVSGDVTKVIRKLVPEISEVIAEAKAGKANVQPVEKPVEKPVAKVEAPAVKVVQKKAPYRGMYGAVYSRAVSAGEVVVNEFIPQTAQAILTDPVHGKVIEKIKARHGDADLVAQVTKAIRFAVGVIRTPKHQSNMNRSQNISSVRGCMQIVGIEG